MKYWGVGKFAVFLLYTLVNDVFFIGGAVWLVLAHHWSGWIIALGSLLACGQWRPKDPGPTE